MQHKHVALTSSSEENADTFYADLLGLTKSGPKALPRDIAKALFNLDREQVHFEIFITPSGDETRPKIEHTCLEVDNLGIFLEKCRRLNLDMARIPKGDKTLTFIKDFDGNLFEIKSG